MFLNKNRVWRRPVSLLIILLALTLLAGGCGRQKQAAPQEEKKLPVVATIYPLADFSGELGGKRVQVTQLIPQGSEPHDWEPSPKDLLKLYQAKVIVYNGAGLEPWMEKQLPALKERGIIIVRASDGIDLLTFNAEEKLGITTFVGNKAAGGREDLSGTDPHIWLDPRQAERISRGITAALIKADPAGSAEYKRRQTELEQSLSRLDGEYQAAAAKFTRRDLVVAHTAFGYLARRYQLKQIPVLGLTPEQEPDAETLSRLVDYCRRHQVKYIFFESLVSPRVSETIAREVGARTMELTPLDGLTKKEAEEELDYFGLMRRNLANLKEVLGEKP